MKFGNAKLCFSCNEIFEEGYVCPKCGGTAIPVKIFTKAFAMTASGILKTAATDFLIMTHEKGLDKEFPSEKDVMAQIKKWESLT